MPVDLIPFVRKILTRELHKVEFPDAADWTDGDWQAWGRFLYVQGVRSNTVFDKPIHGSFRAAHLELGEMCKQLQKTRPFHLAPAKVIANHLASLGCTLK